MPKFLVPVMLAITVLGAPTAWAHADLVETSPAQGEVISEAPASIVLRFNEEPLEAMVDVVITDATGEVVAMDAAEASGTEVVMPWPGAIGTGDYTVAYRVVSADGHPITGTFGFTYTGDAMTDSAPAIDEAAAAEVLADVTEPQSSNLPLIIGVAVLIVVTVAVALLATRRRTRR